MKIILIFLSLRFWSKFVEIWFSEKKHFLKKDKDFHLKYLECSTKADGFTKKAKEKENKGGKNGQPKIANKRGIYVCIFFKISSLKNENEKMRRYFGKVKNKRFKCKTECKNERNKPQKASQNKVALRA